MHSVRPWIGVALLAVSWLFGLDYYELPSFGMQAVLLVLGLGMLAASERANPLRAVQKSYPELTVAVALCLLPVVWWTPWPYRLAPLVLMAGVLLERATYAPRLLRPVAAGWVIGGAILLLQAVAITVYGALTARSHDLPSLLVRGLSGLCWLAGIDAACDGPLLVMQSMRQPIRLAITWDMVFDPATMMFLVSGLVWIAVNSLKNGERRASIAANLARLLIIVFAWLPVRAVLMVALYLHRAALGDPTQPLHVANQFLSSWVLLATLAVPIVLAWQIVRMADSAPQESLSSATEKTATVSSLSVRYLTAAACCLFGAILLAVGLQWEPVGKRKEGRVMWVERHAPWSPTDRPYDTEHFGGGVDEDSVSYTYSVAYRYLGQYYDVSRLNESDAIDDRTLAGCDVLVIKMPGVRYSADEVRAVVDFVRNGGGLLLIGDHTNLDLTSTHMNDIARSFGFIFRDDVLYSTQPSPNREHYAAPWAPHPAIQHVPEFDFAVSCSIDPGYSWGRPVVAPAGLWSMPMNFEYSNYMPEPQHVPEMRFGSFIQAWATHSGSGRVIAWGDSTIFSNFCIGQPGKFAVLLNAIEWLNHQGGTGAWWLWTLLGLATIGNGLWQVRRDGSAWLVLLAATACGWTLGTTASAALLARDMPLPKPIADHRMPLVVIDRTTSRVPLANADQNDDLSGAGFGLLEQWIPRLGYTTVRAEGDAIFQGDVIVMLYPNAPVSAEFRRRLVEYVDRGGRLLVIDAGVSEIPSTANQILRPFGLSLDYGISWQGELVIEEPWPRNQVEHAWEVFGGKSFATLNGERAVCSTVEYGKGLVMVASFGTMFNDRHMSGPWVKSRDEVGLWGKDPTPEERTRYDVLFTILRRLVKDELPPAVSPPRTSPAGLSAIRSKPAKPKATGSLKIPEPMDSGVGRRGKK